MKIPKFQMRKKVRATTARRSAGAVNEMDYEEMSEPNMKLSRALLIVLVLHVVAVAGIIAFNTIKSRQGTFPRSSESAAPATTDAAQSAPPKGETAALASAANESMLPRREEIKPALPVAKALPADTRKPDGGKTAQASATGADEGKYYIVAKGDNPVSIAKKLKVSQSDLLSANQITDPTKLQIGQKLIIPPQKSSSKTAAKSKKSSD